MPAMGEVSKFIPFLFQTSCLTLADSENKVVKEVYNKEHSKKLFSFLNREEQP
jgi:hypothetical protein